MVSFVTWLAPKAAIAVLLTLNVMAIVDPPPAPVYQGETWEYCPLSCASHTDPLAGLPDDVVQRIEAEIANSAH